MRTIMPGFNLSVKKSFGSSCLVSTIFAVLFIFACGVRPAWAQDLTEDDFKAAPGPGQQTFSSTCAGCHGLDGRGSERAPSIAASAKVQHLSDAQIASIISNGIPGTGMPSFHTLSAAQVRSVVNYLRVLQGKLNVRSLPGNPQPGKEIFFGKGECGSCHSFSGQGGFFGPDLSTYGSTLSAKAILDAIMNPSRTPQPGFKPAAVTTRDGQHIEGLVRNEDNFSLQLLDKDGGFHFFEKGDLQSFGYLPRSFMPSDYADRLTKTELNDLVSFLMNAASAQPARHAREEN
jgi:cytochrome c oxidase cbb3-type subunit III